MHVYLQLACMIASRFAMTHFRIVIFFPRLAATNILRYVFEVGKCNNREDFVEELLRKDLVFRNRMLPASPDPATFVA
jgi:hypothetical protein